MKNQFCSYEIALKLKELGFDEDCFGYFISNHDMPDVISCEYGNEKESSSIRRKVMLCSAPLWQQVIDWLRERHNIHVMINLHDVCDSKTWRFDVREGDSFYYVSTHDNIELNLPKYYNTQNEAREPAILKALELINAKE